MRDDMLALLAYWIDEREAIRQRRAVGLLKPWSDDPVFQQYRFCNVDREDDKVTGWIRENWRKPYQYHPNLWFAMCIARLVNWPDTLQELGFPETWDPSRFVQVLQAREARGEKVWTGAYMIRGSHIKGTDKPTWVAENLTSVWCAGEYPGPRGVDTLSMYHGRLMRHRGFGSFLSAQVVADLKHTRWLCDAPDWWNWAAPGPGSTQGLNRIMGRPLETKVHPEQFIEEWKSVRRAVAPTLRSRRVTMCLQNWQNCGCEFDKYCRVKEGGRARNRFAGAV